MQARARRNARLYKKMLVFSIIQDGFKFKNACLKAFFFSDKHSYRFQISLIFIIFFLLLTQSFKAAANIVRRFFQTAGKILQAFGDERAVFHSQHFVVNNGTFGLAQTGQYMNVRRGAFGQGFQLITAFQHRYHPLHEALACMIL